MSGASCVSFAVLPDGIKTDQDLPFAVAEGRSGNAAIVCLERELGGPLAKLAVREPTEDTRSGADRLWEYLLSHDVSGDPAAVARHVKQVEGIKAQHGRGGTGKAATPAPAASPSPRPAATAPAAAAPAAAGKDTEPALGPCPACGRGMLAVPSKREVGTYYTMCESKCIQPGNGKPYRDLTPAEEGSLASAWGHPLRAGTVTLPGGKVADITWDGRHYRVAGHEAALLPGRMPELAAKAPVRMFGGHAGAGVGNTGRGMS